MHQKTGRSPEVASAASLAQQSPSTACKGVHRQFQAAASHTDWPSEGGRSTEYLQDGKTYLPQQSEILNYNSKFSILTSRKIISTL